MPRAATVLPDPELNRGKRKSGQLDFAIRQHKSSSCTRHPNRQQAKHNFLAR